MSDVELQSSNYPQTITQHESVSLVLHFTHTIDEFSFKTIWLNPHDKIVKTKYWTLNASYNRNGQFIHESIARRLLIPGQWKILVLTVDQVDENVENGDILLAYEFIVMPENLDKIRLVSEKLSAIWRLDSICNRNDKELSGVQRCEDTYWSTLYPDPKSDLILFFKNMN